MVLGVILTVKMRLNLVPFIKGYTFMLNVIDETFIVDESGQHGVCFGKVIESLNPADISFGHINLS
jgi:hypothetical protein